MYFPLNCQRFLLPNEEKHLWNPGRTPALWSSPLCPVVEVSLADPRMIPVPIEDMAPSGGASCSKPY